MIYLLWFFIALVFIYFVVEGIRSSSDPDK